MTDAEGKMSTSSNLLLRHRTDHLENQTVEIRQHHTHHPTQCPTASTTKAYAAVISTTIINFDVRQCAFWLLLFSDKPPTTHSPVKSPQLCTTLINTHETNLPSTSRRCWWSPKNPYRNYSLPKTGNSKSNTRGSTATPIKQSPPQRANFQVNQPNFWTPATQPMTNFFLEGQEDGNLCTNSTSTRRNSFRHDAKRLI